MKATHRWMVSGTPIAGKIDSLHGELNFLQVIGLIWHDLRVVLPLLLPVRVLLGGLSL